MIILRAQRKVNNMAGMRPIPLGTQLPSAGHKLMMTKESGLEIRHPD
jgi:hypothetical protein